MLAYAGASVAMENGEKSVRRAARFVGHTLARLEEDGYPCHRVVNCAGRTAPGWPAQTALLAAEGVGFKPNGCVDLARFLWDGVEKRI